MTELQNYLQMGLDHILDVHAYDHLLFIASLLVVYALKDWKRVIILLTAFTIGHGISLISALFEFFPIPRDWVEFLIPLSILITAFLHLVLGKTKVKVMYSLALLFGLIHGMAYARDFVIMMGSSTDIIGPLLAFNLGIELAQIGFGLLLLVILYIAEKLKLFQLSLFRMFIFGVIITLASQLLLAKWMW